MKATLRRLARDTAAQDIAEYGLALAVVSIAAGAAAMRIGVNVSTLFTRAVQTLVLAVLGSS